MALSAVACKRPRRDSPPSLPRLRADLNRIPSLPMTPPDPSGGDPMPVLDSGPSSLETALHVLSTERDALQNLRRIYATDDLARSSLDRAVTQIATTVRVGGKLVLSGVGKSGLIAKKVVATMNSMGIHSIFLHPTEALHGDLGMVRENDTVLFITFSGKTSELLLLLPHLPSTVTIIAITAHRDSSTCPLFFNAGTRTTILLPAPVHEREEVSFGLPAPMSSTTVALAIGDALALAAARKLHNQPGRGPAEVFREFHPGGAIGAAFAAAASSSATSSSPSSLSAGDPSTAVPEWRTSSSIGSSLDIRAPSPERPPEEKKILELVTRMSHIPLVQSRSPSGHTSLRVGDILRATVMRRTRSDWIRVADDTRVISPRRIRFLAKRMPIEGRLKDVPGGIDNVVVPREKWLVIPQFLRIRDVHYALRGLRLAAQLREEGRTQPDDSNQEGGAGRYSGPQGRIIAAVDKNDNVIGFVEEEDVWLDGRNDDDDDDNDDDDDDQSS
ncbi:hypothetical protein VTO42DRAFT_6198 [Malbranchea cinnamomea]